MADETAPTHLKWPLELATARDGSITFATVEQDSPEEMRRSAGLLCELRYGQLPWDDDLGIPDPLGSTDPESAAAAISAALDDLDPRTTHAVDVIDDPESGARRITNLRVELT